MNDRKKALVFLADGCEEIEAVTAIDVLRRGGVDVCACSAGSGDEVRGAHGIVFAADAVLPADPDEAAAFAAPFDALVVPGGMGGVGNLAASRAVLAALRAADARGAVVAAVCAGPMVLDAAGLLSGRRHCCYPGIEERLSGGGKFVPGATSETDGHLVTGTGPGTAMEFALEVLRALGGPAASVAEGLLFGKRE